MTLTHSIEKTLLRSQMRSLTNISYLGDLVIDLGRGEGNIIMPFEFDVGPFSIVFEGFFGTYEKLIMDHSELMPLCCVVMLVSLLQVLQCKADISLDPIMDC